VLNLLKSPAQMTRPRIPDGTRIYTIGDVHGRADLLSELFIRIDTHLGNCPSPRPVHVLLGDYIDRGPNSRGVLDLLINRRRQHTTLCLKGNHETYVPELLSDPSVLNSWRLFGGLSTLMSYGLIPPLNPTSAEHEELAEALRRAIPESHLKFFGGLPLTFTCGDFFSPMPVCGLVCP
jgi:serine/threonine protein phosphatase 1